MKEHALSSDDDDEEEEDGKYDNIITNNRFRHCSGDPNYKTFYCFKWFIQSIMCPIWKVY